jgi:nitrogen regulatory protein P-II 1
MKLILAYVPPEHMNRVIDALSEHHVPGLTVSEARGFGQEHDTGHPEHHEYLGLEMTRKLRLEIACGDEEVNSIMAAVYEAAHTGQRGAGKVLVLPVEDALRLRTGERGQQALQSPSDARKAKER